MFTRGCSIRYLVCARLQLHLPCFAKTCVAGQHSIVSCRLRFHRRLNEIYTRSMRTGEREMTGPRGPSAHAANAAAARARLHRFSHMSRATCLIHLIPFYHDKLSSFCSTHPTHPYFLFVDSRPRREINEDCLASRRLSLAHYPLP